MERIARPQTYCQHIFLLFWREIRLCQNLSVMVANIVPCCVKCMNVERHLCGKIGAAEASKEQTKT